MIEVGDQVKRIGDMQTEDFITCSTKAPDVELVYTTVLKIVSQNNNVVVVTLTDPSIKSMVRTRAVYHQEL